MTNSLLRISTPQGMVCLAIKRWESNSSRVLILLHGWLHSKEIWSHVAPLLTNDFTVVAIDLPGFGDSPPLTDDRTNITGYAVVVSAAVAALGAGSNVAGIVGDSLSGVILANAAGSDSLPPTQYLAFSGCPFDGLPCALRLPFLSYFLMIGLRVMRHAPAPMQRSWISRLARFTLYKDVESGEIIAGVQAADTRAARQLFDDLKSRVSPAVRSVLRRRRCLIIRGEYDHIARRVQSVAWATELGGSYVELAQCGHVPMIEDPITYADCVRKFFGCHLE